MKSIADAIEIVGSQTGLARLLGVSAPAVTQWLKGLRPVPVKHCVSIEKATGGVVTRKDLRPSDWEEIWPELQG